MCAQLVPALIDPGADGYSVILDIPVPSSLEKNAQQAHVDPAAPRRMALGRRSGPARASASAASGALGKLHGDRKPPQCQRMLNFTGLASVP